MTHPLRIRLLAIALALVGPLALVTHPSFAQVDPPLTPLPYTEVIRIGEPTPCLECPPLVCPEDPATTYTAPSCGAGPGEAFAYAPVPSGRPSPPSFTIAAVSVVEDP